MVDVTTQEILDAEKKGSSVSEIDMGSTVVNAFTNVVKSGAEFTAMLKNTAAITQNQITLLGALSAAAFSTENTFRSANFDNESIVTFSKQIKGITDGLLKSGAPVSAFADLAKKALGAIIPDELSKVPKLAADYVMSLANAADNSLYLQNAIFKMAGATGGLDEMLQVAGNDLKNVNTLLSVHNDIIDQTTRQTHDTTGAVQKYYMQLGLIPKALESVVTSATNADSTVTMLAATMQYSTGSGRLVKDVIDDLSDAFKNYDLVGEEALLFTARIGEISNKYNVQLSNVRESLKSTASEFKMFGHESGSASKMMEGASKMMNDYVESLKATGISGATAVEVVTNMSKKVAELDVATRSFISGQTGGPGGLRGAFQIEKMIKEGNMDEVMDKVRETMKKQFGKIVSVEEASQSESAAAMLVRQRTMLTQGPLGQFARTEQEAGRMLESFSIRDKGGATDLSANILHDTMERGSNFQKLTATYAGDIYNLLVSQKNQADVAVLGYVQQTATAGSGSSTQFENSTEAQINNRRNITDTGEAAGKRASDTALSLQRAGAGKDVMHGSISKQINAAIIEDFQRAYDNASDAVKATYETLLNAVKGNTVNDEIKKFEKEIAELKERRTQLTEKDATNAEEVIRQKQSTLNDAKWFINRRNNNFENRPLPPPTTEQPTSAAPAVKPRFSKPSESAEEKPESTGNSKNNVNVTVTVPEILVRVMADGSPDQVLSVSPTVNRREK